MSKISIIHKLKARRIELGITQQDVADKMGIAQQSVTRMERGGVSPSIDMIERYAEAVGCRVKIEKKEEK